VGAAVTPSGVLRPTTRSPVLVCHPDDLAWFSDTRVLPELTRTTGAGTDHATLQLVPSAALAPGLAFLDAPDIDSVVTANRRLAGQLLAAADLWLFVTTAARYADAVPWDVLETAAARGTALAVLLDRVPPGAEREVAAHLHEMLAAHGLGSAPLFVVPECALVDGMLPDPVVAPIRRWFDDLARDAAGRAAVIRRTLDGALDSLRPRAAGLAAHAQAQSDAAARLRADVRAAYAAAIDEVDDGMRDGALLRGEVLARWQEFVGTGELLRTLQTKVGRWRDRFTAAVTGRPAPGGDLTVALESGVALLVHSAAGRAAEAAAAAWRAGAAGTGLLRASSSAGERLDRVSPGFRDDAERTVREWQGAVLDLVRSEGAGRRTTARAAAYGVNATGLVVMIAVFATTSVLAPPIEVAVAGGTTVLSQKVLEAVFGDQAVRALADRARADLLDRVAALLGREEDRFARLLHEHGTHPDDAAALERAAAAVEQAR
ncbi:MAG: ABC transporter, partial [Pseudonocardia sp.]|nr:ABC transporter [Pseudonocardia sp.]